MGAASDPDLVGVLLDERYKILSLLGRGGMGDVYVALETKLQRKVAVKVLHHAKAKDPEHVERFLREAQTIAQLDHPNVVEIFAYGETPAGLVYFAMELLDGEDLEARLRARRERPIGVYEACQWAIQIARAAMVVHEAKQIHRDLKPSNIFLARRKDGELRIKLLDFGIARPEEGSDLTRTGLALGTPNYMSPEQLRNEALDRRSDIYSFGVLLFRLLTGRLPFFGDPLQVAAQHCDTPPPRPSVVAPEAGISAALEEIVLNCMAKRRDNRFQSMRAVEAALTAILEDEAPAMLGPVVGRTIPPVTIGPAPAARGAEVHQPKVAAASQLTGQTTVVQRRGDDRRLQWFAVGGAFALAAVALVLVLLPGGGQVAVPQSVPVAASAPAVTSEPARPSAPPAEPPKPVEVTKTEPPPPPPEPPKPAETKTEPAKVVEPRPAKSAESKARTPTPVQQIEQRAKVCRRKHGAAREPKITIDYAIGSDGKVIRSAPSVDDELGRCLADAVRQAQFEPKLMLAQKIEL